MTTEHERLEPGRHGSDSPHPTLEDLGELRLLDEVVLPLARRYDTKTSAGDDCAFIEVGSVLLAVSSDMGPRPLVRSLRGHENDMMATGWHAAVTTVSDIATAGALPLLLSNCVDAPPTLAVDDFAAFMEGYFQACSKFGFYNGGGDIRQGQTLGARVFGVGLVEHGRKIGRRGARPGDHLVIIGHPGRFMATYLLARQMEGNRLEGDDAKILRFPEPPVEEMRMLAREGLVASASDSSDGVLGAVDNIARGSNCDFIFSLDSEAVPELIQRAALVNKLDPWNILFCWGDWCDAVIVPATEYEAFEKFAAEHKIAWLYLGSTEAGSGKLWAETRLGRRRLRPLRNENFVRRGFNADLSAHLSYMLETPLFLSNLE